MATEFQSLIYLGKGLLYVYGQMSSEQKVFLFSALITMFGVIYGLIISPIIFNYYIIPNIEKKLGKFLKFNPYIRYIAMGRWMCLQVEVSLHIIKLFYEHKFGKKHKLPKMFSRYGMRDCGYTIEMVSRFELIASFILIFSNILVVLSSFIALFASGQLTLFYHSSA